MARIVRFHEYGDASVLKIENLDVPPPDSDEVQIEVKSFGLNRAEVMFRTHAYFQEAQFPSRLGFEAAGIVKTVGRSATGFKKKDLADVTVSAEQIQSVNVTMEVGDVTQSVTVNGDVTPPIDTETGQISSTLDSKAIQNLPSLGCDPFQLLRLAPGVFAFASLAFIPAWRETCFLPFFAYVTTDLCQRKPRYFGF